MSKVQVFIAAPDSIDSIGASFSFSNDASEDFANNESQRYPFDALVEKQLLIEKYAFCVIILQSLRFFKFSDNLKANHFPSPENPSFTRNKSSFKDFRVSSVHRVTTKYQAVGLPMLGF